MDIEDFLFRFFAQRHFDIMPADVRARFDDYRANNDFNGHMKNWTQNHIDANGAASPLPELTTRDDVLALYNLVQAIFQEMAANSEDFKDITPVKKFHEKWFGDNKIFNYSQATPEAESDINAVKDLLKQNKAKLNIVLRANNVLSDTFTIDNLIDGIEAKKYNKKPKFRRNMLYAIDYILTYQDRGDPSYWPINARINFNQPDTSNWFQVSTTELDKFRTGSSNNETSYIDLLNTLVSSKLIRDNFVKYDSKGTISEQLSKALKETAYDDPESKDFVAAKTKEVENVIDKIKDWKDETYEQYFRKLFSSRGSRKYFSTYAYEIVKAIDKEKIKPTDGIDGILNKKDALLKRFGDKSPTTKKHFEWFEKAMTEVKKRVPHSYEKAFSDGRKLKQVVSQVIIKAIADDKIEEAKTTLELLSVCKYGFTTSKTMTALKDQNITILSDKNLSWNKGNQVMQALSNAADNMVKFGLKAVGHSANVLRNIHQQRLSKFRGDKGELAPHIEADKQKKQRIINEERRNAQQLLTNNNTELATLAAGGGSSHERIIEANLNNLIAERTNREQIFRQNENAYNAAAADINLLSAKERFDSVSAEIQTMENQRNALYNDLYNLVAGTPEYNEKSQEILAVEQEIYNKQQSIATLTPVFQNPTPQITAQLNNARVVRDNYNVSKTNYETLNEDITNFENLRTENATLSHQINEYEERINNWDTRETDNYRNLMAYWDILQTFNKTHSFEMATLDMQARNLIRQTQNINGRDVTKTMAQWEIEQEIARYRYNR